MRKVLALLAGLILASCGQGSPTWTLYRTNVAGGDRIHLATFDADDTGGGTHKFNELNCSAAVELFQKAATELAEEADARPVSYWCEQGTYSE